MADGGSAHDQEGDTDALCWRGKQTSFCEDEDEDDDM